jgi:SAM-dependent methyltransferase
VRNHRKAPSLRSLYQSFSRLVRFSATAEAKVELDRRVPLPIFTPPLHVDTSADADALHQLWQNVRLAWESLGNKRPFYSVLTNERYLPDRIAQSEPQFWESGRAEVEQLAGYLRSIGIASCKDLTVVDYGCGVGRVTVPLAAIAREVIAYDISEPHLKLARERAAALGRTNIRTIAARRPIARGVRTMRRVLFKDRAPAQSAARHRAFASAVDPFAAARRCRDFPGPDLLRRLPV